MQPNDMSKLYFDKEVSPDTARQLVGQIVDASDFVASDLSAIHLSKWWDQQAEKVGAATVLGTYQGLPAVLKVQFVKPNTSEFALIREFGRQSQGRRIRPPRIFQQQQWGSEGPFEMTVMEIAPQMVIPVNKQALAGDISEFFRAFREYRQVTVKPFLQKPTALARDRIIESFHMWKTIRTQLDTEGFITGKYQKIIDEAINYLHQAYGEVETQFCHGHFSAQDVRKVGSDWVLLSNLYWSFRVPWYDLVFGWHWRRWDLMANRQLWEAAVFWEQPLWENEMKTVVGQMGEQVRLYRLARLERAVAGLNLDLLTLAPELTD